MTYGSIAVRARLRRIVAICISASLLAVAAPAAANAADYVAMGDSYSSGTGTREYYEGCERSVYSYPYLIKGSLGSSFKFIACGGAKTQDVLNNQVSSLDASTKYVTISIGGNDAGFSSVITECAKPRIPFTSGCDDDIANAQSFINNTLPGRLNSVYSEIRRRAPNAIVGVVGYPRLFNGEDCNAGTFFSSDELTKLNQTADILASVTRARAQAFGFTFVDARGAFLGHAVCDNTEWLNGLSNPVGESYHPNRTGHSSGYASIVRSAMQAAAFPGAPVGGVGRIAFSSNRDGNSEVYVVNSNGQFPVNLTNDPASDVDPAWSPDGTKVAFASNRDGDNEIYVMDGDGGGVTKLTNNTGDDREPTWSPNGAYIAFRSDRTGNNEVFRMTASGASQTNITNNSASDFAPDWSPDGAEIAFQRSAANNEVFKANADGQGQTNLTNNGANDGRPAWAPNGSLAFHSNRDGDFEIFTMSALGGSVTQRTANTASDQDPAWSPDGAQIAFQTSRNGNDEIYTMTATGATQTNRTNASASDVGPAWQADSTPPRTTIGAGPNDPGSDARPSFEFASSELGSTHQCKVDDGPFATCVSPFRAAALADGEHTFSVRSTDPSGNVDPNPPVRTFVVDTTAPVVQVECPETVLLNAAASATVTATDATAGLGAIDDPTGDHPLDTSQPGMHTFSVHAIDLAGNRGEAECTYEVRYPDPGTPAVAEGGNPNAGDFTIGWAASAPASYPIRYVLERRDAGDADWHEVAAGIDGTAHAFTSGDAADEGTWRYRVRGVDAENGVETGWSEPSDPVKVDQSAPAAPGLSADRAPEYAGDGGWFRDSVVISTTDNGDPDLRDGSAGSGVDPASVAAPATLDHGGTVTRTVRDAVGNESPPAQLSVKVDGHAPSLALDCPESVVLHGTAVARVTAADGESGLADDPTGTVDIDTSRVGTQLIERTASDNVGHRRTERCEVLVRYDYSLDKLAADGSDTFEQGSTLPIRIGLTDASGDPVSTAELKIELERLGPGGDVAEVVDGTATNGKDFDYSARRYTFNLSTKSLAPGTWRIAIHLDDGTVHRTPITLR